MFVPKAPDVVLGNPPETGQLGVPEAGSLGGEQLRRPDLGQFGKLARRLGDLQQLVEEPGIDVAAFCQLLHRNAGKESTIELERPFGRRRPDR